MRYLLASFIRLYQLSFSPDHSVLFRGRFPHGFCRFYPSCSEYTRQSILEFGTIRGIGLGVIRLLRCNPFTQPKIDLPN